MMSFDSSSNRKNGRNFVVLILLVFLTGCAGSKQNLSPKIHKIPSERVSNNARKAFNHVILGAMYETQGDFIRAINQYNQALLYDSASSSLYQSIADNYQQIGEFESARIILKRGIIHGGEDHDILVQYGDISFMTDRLDDAADTFEKITKLYPGDHESWFTLGSVYIRQGKHLESVECYNRVMEIRGLDMDILVRQASVLSIAREYKLAIDAYTQMHYLQPDDALIPFTIGGLFLETGDSLSADSAFEVATNLNPNNTRYWELRIRLSIVLHDTLKSLKLIDEALENNEDNTNLLALASSLYSQLDRFEDAEMFLLRAADLDTSNVSHLINLGFLYHELGRWEDAEQVYLRGLAINADDALLNNNYAYMLAETGKRLEVAIMHVEKALEIEPDNPSFLDTKGWLFFLTGDLEKAISFLDAAVKTTPDNPEILDHLGEVYYSLGNIEQARMMWTKAIEKGADEGKILPKLNR